MTKPGAPAATQRFANLLRRPAQAEVPPWPATPCAVRVVAGLHRGATLRLREPALIGSDTESDIVLRDPEVRAPHAEMRRVDGSWGVFDSRGGHAIAAFETARRGRFTRRRYAIGAAQIVITQPMPLEAEPAPRPPLSSRLWAPALVLVAASFGAVAIVHLMTPATASIATGTRSLARDGWPDVEWVATANAPLLVRGHVDNAASLAQLQRWLNAQNLGNATVSVRIGSELAARVREALADPGLTVDYRPGGSVRVQGTSDKIAVRERLRRITADLAGAVRVDDRVAFIEAPDTTPKKYVLPLRIVDVRPGAGDSGGSFGSDNGARYFVGATLSDGSEVVAINEDSIEFSMAGRRINYPLK